MDWHSVFHLSKLSNWIIKLEPVNRKSRRAERHHFVPQFYLRGWANSADKIAVWPREGGKGFLARPRSFACEKGLYDTSDHDELSDWDSERELSRIEGLYSEVWPDIFQRAYNPRTKRNLARFLALLDLRHPSNKERLRMMARMDSEILASVPDGQEQIPVTLPDGTEALINVSEIRAHQQSGEKGIDEDFLWFMRSQVEPLAEAFFQRRWGVYVSETPVFYTSDLPLVTWRHNCEKPFFGYGTSGTMITLPLSPYKLLAIHDDFSRDGMSYPLEELGNLNDGCWKSGAKFIFGCPEWI